MILKDYAVPRILCYLQQDKKWRTLVQRSETVTKKMVNYLINHHSQSNCYLIKIMRGKKPVFFFFVFFLSFQLNCSNAYIRAITSEQLSTNCCYEVIIMSLKRQMLTEIFIRNIIEKVKSSSWVFCKVSFKCLKCTRQFLWKILMGCTLIILHMIFSEGFTYIPLYSKHISRKS